MTKKAPACVSRYNRPKSRNPRSMIVKLPGSGVIRSSTFTSCILPSEIWMNEGILPRKSIWVCLHGGFCLAKMCPRKHAERKINRCRVESVYGVVQINPEVVVHIELACRYNQGLGKITIDAPITVLVSISQSASGNVAANTEVIKLGFVGSQANFDVPQAFSERQLRKRHA